MWCERERSMQIVAYLYFVHLMLCIGLHCFVNCVSDTGDGSPREWLKHHTVEGLECKLDILDFEYDILLEAAGWECMISHKLVESIKSEVQMINSTNPFNVSGE